MLRPASPGYGDDTALLDTLGANFGPRLCVKSAGEGRSRRDDARPTRPPARARSSRSSTRLTRPASRRPRDAGAFFPQPNEVYSSPCRRSFRAASPRIPFTVPVLIVSGDPLNATPAVDRIYALADEVALALDESNYRPSSFRSSVNAEPLPALELTVTVTVTDIEGS